MLFAVFFAFWRFLEILTLIPIVGMLAYFVSIYNNANLLTPSYILVLFIVSVLALAWALFTIFSYHRSSSNALFVGIIDLGFVGAFIAGVYYLRFISAYDCANVSAMRVNLSLGIFGGVTLNTLNLDLNKTCSMLKASWAFGIMNCVFFFFTAVLALMHGNKAEKEVVKVRRRSHSGHRRSHSGHRRSHSGHRSSHSHSRAYV